jgi:hypothetical protein
MKRTLAIAATACMLVVPAIASGQTFVGIFDGHLDGNPDSPVTLKFNGAVNPGGDVDTRLTLFAVHNLAVNCDDGVVATLDHAKLKGGKGGIAIGDGKNFRVKDNNGTTEFKVNGRIGQNKAFGNFRLTGKIEGTDGVTRECDSGRLGWVARP